MGNDKGVAPGFHGADPLGLNRKKFTRDESENWCPITHLAEQEFRKPTSQKSLKSLFVAQPRTSPIVAEDCLDNEQSSMYYGIPAYNTGRSNPAS